MRDRISDRPSGNFVAKGTMRHALLFATAHALQFNSPFDVPKLKNPFKSKDDGATVVKVQLAFNCVDRGPGSILGRLDAMAAAANTDTNRGLEQLASDTGLLLLRRLAESHACAGTVVHHGDDDVALRAFDQEVIREAAKFDRETRPGVASLEAQLNAGTSAPPLASTVAVCSVIATLMGDREEEIGVGADGSLSGDRPGTQRALQVLAAAAAAEREVFAFELLWVPGEGEDTLDADEVVLEWPELIAC